MAKEHVVITKDDVGVLELKEEPIKKFTDTEIAELLEKSKPPVKAVKKTHLSVNDLATLKSGQKYFHHVYGELEVLGVHKRNVVCKWTDKVIELNAHELLLEKPIEDKK